MTVYFLIFLVVALIIKATTLKYDCYKICSIIELVPEFMSLQFI